jgi:2-succinyl-5-enolpyruvyl-6-hydroxy-3-cyclohexene-1-carboxylate synthase
MGEGTLNQRWAAHLVGALVQGGVRLAVIAPGSRSSPLALAFADRPDVRSTVVLDERVAGFFALGLAKGSQAPVAVVVTSGTAGAHLLPAVIEAAEGGTPLVVLTADRPWELHHFGAPQTIEQAGLFGAFVRDAVALPAPEELPDLFAHLVRLAGRAVRRATDAPRGPVHLNVPFREPLAPADAAPGPVVDPPGARFHPAPTAPDLAGVLERVARAERGLIVCGPRERHDDFPEAVHRLGAELGFPVLAEAASNARYGFPDAVAMYDVVWRTEALAQALRPDLLLRFGAGLTPKSMLQLGAPAVVQVSEDGRLFDPHHAATEVVTGSAVQFCEALRGARPRTEGWRQRWLGVEAELRRRLGARTGLDEPLLARDLVAQLPVGSNLVLSSSMPVRDVDAFAPAAAGRLRVFSNRAVNGIDGVTSTALGVAAATGQPTTLLIGDVAFLHDLGAWVLARHLGVSLTVVVVNNDGGGIFHFLPIAERTAHFERLFGTPHGVDLAQVAAVGGARHLRLATAPALKEALPRCLEGGLHVLEIRTDRQENVAAHRGHLAALSGGFRA